MLNILVNAYACSPNWGSEPGMAWNWIVNLSKHCNLYIITEGEWKDEILEAVEKLPQKNNIHFYFNPVSDKIRKMCWNQGDWRFYYYYRIWQKKTLNIAKNICSTNKIDVLHQLNMIGFREPGYLWKIKDVPFIWGPIGSMGAFPVVYLKDLPLKYKLKYELKNFITKYQIISPRVRHAIVNSSALVAAVDVTRELIKTHYDKDAIVINETGADISTTLSPERNSNSKLKLLWVGRFIIGKQLSLALQTVSHLKDIKGIELHIVGGGNEKEEQRYKEEALNLGINDICVWHGVIPNLEVLQLMKEADLFFFTSISEATSTVVLEAIGNCLPVVCFDACGFGAIIDESIGRKVKLSTPSKSVLDFAEIIRSLYTNRNLLYVMSQACTQRQQELSWDSKAKQMVEIYNSVTNNYKTLNNQC